MCIKGSYEVERGLGGEYKKANMKRCDVRLVLKEGWPDHFYNYDTNADTGRGG